MPHNDAEIPARRRVATGAMAAVFVAAALGCPAAEEAPIVESPEVAPEAEVAPEPVPEQVAAAPADDAAPPPAPAEEGVLGLLQQESGHFLASPSGSAFAVGEDDEAVWGGLTGTETGESLGLGGLGLIGSGGGGGGFGGRGIGMGSGYGRGSRHAGMFAMRMAPSRESYAKIDEQGFVAVDDDRQSTFSIDVDTASYSNVRRMLTAGMLPPPDAVRIEELVNYFDYDVEPPSGETPFAVHSEVAPCPWAEEHLLVKLGLAGQKFDDADLPTRNFVFLVDVSGSMRSSMPLVQRSLGMLVDHMRPQDRVGIVVYAGASGVVLEPTLGSDKPAIRRALARLSAGGSTNGGAGIELAYRLARKNFVADGANRVILATDGDFNVGVTSQRKLDALIEKKRESGVFLSVLGYGRGNLADARMERLADRGNGNYAYIDSAQEARKVLVTEAAANLVTIAKDVKIQVEFDPAEVASWRLVGYENRKLAHRDFADDTKDAGEIGAGHTVTALYEIVPARSEGERTGDLMKVALRWKPMDGGEAQSLEHAVSSDARSLAAASNDLRLAAAIAQFGMLLRGSDHRGDATWTSTAALVSGVVDERASCERAELAQLVGLAARMSGSNVTVPRGPSCPAT